ncbi:uncharacterized protein PG986_010848 [Apiospora aurea]|uniref:Uncharacterized protein n=1 Tax=Apiospora aurea TaxID=335848 RepID=A0ABR1Q3I6_9PEZI
MYVVTGPHNVQALFRSSKKLTFEGLQLPITRLLEDMPAADADKWWDDDPGTTAVLRSPSQL